MKRKLFLYLVYICLILLVIQLIKYLMPDIFGALGTGGLKVISSPDATVYINGLEVGKTPYQDDNLSIGEYAIKLIGDDAAWQGKITLTKGTLSVVNRSLAQSVASSSGESLVLDTGHGITITSSPSDSDVEIDGTLYGKTPLYISDLSSGVHGFSVSHEGYLTRIIDVIAPQDLSLHIDVDLSLVEKQSNMSITPTIALVQKVKIKQTPLGYLRLRENPTIGSKEIAQVPSGDELVYVSEVSGWVKVRLADDTEGYVSSQYIEKLAQ